VLLAGVAFGFTGSVGTFFYPGSGHPLKAFTILLVGMAGAGISAAGLVGIGRLAA
jgi:hypothetical protein